MHHSTTEAYGALVPPIYLADCIESKGRCLLRRGADAATKWLPHIKKVPHDERLRKHCSASAVHVECCERGWGQHRDAPHALLARSAARARQRVRLQQLSTAAAGEGLPAPPRERSTFSGFLGQFLSQNNPFFLTCKMLNGVAGVLPPLATPPPLSALWCT